MKKILVIGSINIDLVSYVKAFPRIGETIDSISFKSFHGGKGANQAVAAVRLKPSDNTKISFFGKVGSDEYSQNEINNMKDNNIDTEYILKSKLNTGKAFITISKEEKDNTIILSKGANSDFSENDISLLTKAISKSDMILLQLETNDFLVDNAIKIANKLNKNVIINPAPSENFKEEWIPYIDWLIPNETELAEITNHRTRNIDEVKVAVDSLVKRGTKNVIVTLGSDGCLLKQENADFKEFSAFKVDAVDSTAAGDTFIGAFSTNMDKVGVEKAIRYAMLAASITVQKMGAQNSIPNREEVGNAKK